MRRVARSVDFNRIAIAIDVGSWRRGCMDSTEMNRRAEIRAVRAGSWLSQDDRHDHGEDVDLSIRKIASGANQIAIAEIRQISRLETVWIKFTAMAQAVAVIKV